MGVGGGSDLEFTCVCSEWASLCDLLGDSGVMFEREGQGRSLRSIRMVGVDGPPSVGSCGTKDFAIGWKLFMPLG